MFWTPGVKGNGVGERPASVDYDSNLAAPRPASEASAPVWQVLECLAEEAGRPSMIEIAVALPVLDLQSGLVSWGSDPAGCSFETDYRSSLWKKWHVELDESESHLSTVPAIATRSWSPTIVVRFGCQCQRHREVVMRDQ